MKRVTAIAVLETREDEEMFTKKYTDYQNRYNAAFHQIMHNIVTYNECGLDIAATVHMFQYVMSAYGIEEFNPTDWDLICNELGRREWARIPSV